MPPKGDVISCPNLVKNLRVVTKLASRPLHVIENFVVSTGVIPREMIKHGYDVRALLFIAVHVARNLLYRGDSLGKTCNGGGQQYTRKFWDVPRHRQRPGNSLVLGQL